jgi:hypothetical protein
MGVGEQAFPAVAALLQEKRQEENGGGRTVRGLTTRSEKSGVTITMNNNRRPVAPRYRQGPVTAEKPRVAGRE